MFKRIPKLPVILILVVIGCWAATRWDLQQRAQILQPMRGPVIALATPTQGVWDLKWPAWPEQRSRPYVAVYGRPFIGFGVHHDPPLFLRVHPLAAVEAGSARPLDADGWFEAGSDYDFDTVAFLDPRKALQIEYRLDRAQSELTDLAYVAINGLGDMLTRKGAAVSSGVIDLLAVLAGLLLTVWFSIALLRRRRRALEPGTSAASS
ncbi:MAG: hypothetical protein JNL28_01180 [Planctomycetes bacterium]|nr:hypothetical protein [Planctomycetota bacterium]